MGGGMVHEHCDCYWNKGEDCCYGCGPPPVKEETSVIVISKEERIQLATIAEWLSRPNGLPRGDCPNPGGCSNCNEKRDAVAAGAALLQRLAGETR